MEVGIGSTNQTEVPTRLEERMRFRRNERAPRATDGAFGPTSKSAPTFCGTEKRDGRARKLVRLQSGKEDKRNQDDFIRTTPPILFC